jgi:hypothetical protein
MGNLKATWLLVALGVTVAALALSSTAFATAVAPEAGGGKAIGNKSGASNGQGAGAAVAARGAPAASKGDGSSADLPFSELDLMVLLGGGALLVASGVTLGGLVLRRARV